LEGIFRKHDEMRGHMLDVELLTLDPKSFENIPYFFTKLRDLLSQLKACGVDKSKEEKQMVLTILSKLGTELSVFISTFHIVRFTSGVTWKMPSLEDFIESLTQERTKLINMGTIKGQRVHALTVHDGSHKYHKYKDKYNGKLMHIRRRKDTQNPSPMPPDPKGKRGEIHILSQRIPFEIHMHEKPNRSNVSNNLAKQPWILHPQGCQEEESKRSKFQERKFYPCLDCHQLLSRCLDHRFMSITSHGFLESSILFFGCMQSSSYSDGGKLFCRSHWQKKD
jgi:hypothetical protein